MPFEPPLPGNPNRLTIQQHVFPRSAIARFTGPGGLVQVQRLDATVPFVARDDNPIFCAKRVWDQKTETARSHPTERAYASLADQLVAGRVTTLTPAMDDLVTRFYVLWCQRHLARSTPMDDVVIKGVLPEPALAKEQEERLELNGYIFARGATLPSRMMTGIAMQVRMDRSHMAMRGVHWGIVRSRSAHFLVPDGSVGLRIVPVAPTICLCQDADDVEIHPELVALTNRLAVDQANGYFLANDLDRCPMIRRTIPTASLLSGVGRTGHAEASRAAWAL